MDGRSDERKRGVASSESEERFGSGTANAPMRNASDSSLSDEANGESDEFDDVLSATSKIAGGFKPRHRINRLTRMAGFLSQLPKGRAVLLLLTGLAALLGLFGALSRANVTSVLPSVAMPDNHGVLMVFGFLGTAISLERAIAYHGGGKKRVQWCFAAPLCGGLGTVVLLVSSLAASWLFPSSSSRLLNVGHVLSGGLWVVSMILLFAIYVAFWRRRPSVDALIQLLASFVGLVGATLWAGGIDVTVLAPMWLMFLVLSIVGERVELARASFNEPHVGNLLMVLCAACVLALVVQCVSPSLGYPVLGLALASLMGCMIWHDVARSTWRNGGLTGFMGTCMLSAYAWGIVASLIWMFAPIAAGGYWTDMGLHALALGFIMITVIAHADIIVPVALHRPMPFHPALWASWVIVQIGLVLRLVGTVRGERALWQVGDTVSVIGILTMMAVDACLVLCGKRILECKRRRRHAGEIRHQNSSIRGRSGSEMAVSSKSEVEASASSSGMRRVPVAKSALKPVAALSAATVLLLAVFAVYALARPSGLGQGSSGSMSGAAMGGTTSAASDSSQSSSSGSASNDLTAGVRATGHTTTSRIHVSGMSFVPGSISLPAGNRLIAVFTNTGDQRHNLTFANGKQSGNVPVGGKVTVDAGTIGKDTVAWCALAGHRQMGMELKVHAIGGKTGTASPTGSSASADASSSADMAVPSAASLKEFARSVQPFDANVPQDEFAGVPGSHNRQYTFNIKECKEKLASGVIRTVWGFDEQSHSRDKSTEPLSPGPILRGRVGDTFHVHLVNHGSMSHSIDFHAGPAVPQEMMRNIEPGKSLDYTFTADHAGIWLYHCSSDPMSNHIANGMFGAVLIEPDNLPAVDAEYVLIGSEMYLGTNGSVADPVKVAAMKPDVMAFNGRAFQYDSHPLPLKAGGRMRIWVMDAGPNIPLSFHVVGTQFDTVWSEGRYLIAPSNVSAVSGQEPDAAAQVLPLEPAQGGFVETRIDKPGKYPFVNHAMSLAEKGEHGFIEVK